jgi:hypothetical protein
VISIDSWTLYLAKSYYPSAVAFLCRSSPQLFSVGAVEISLIAMLRPLIVFQVMVSKHYLNFIFRFSLDWTNW